MAKKNDWKYSVFIHPQETWDEKECLKRSKRIHRDGMGTAGGPKGLISLSGSPYPGYGQTVTYNGGCIRNGELYGSESVPLPKIPEGFKFEKALSWGTRIVKI